MTIETARRASLEFVCVFGQDGLHRPADDTTREQIEDDRQVEPAFPSPDEGYVRHPELVRSFGFEVPTEHVGCDRTIVLAVGRAAKTLAGQALQTNLTHQPCHSLLAHLDVLPVKLATYTLPAVGTTAMGVDRLDAQLQLPILTLSLAGRALHLSVVAAGRYPQVCLLFIHPRVPNLIGLRSTSTMPA